MIQGHMQGWFDVKGENIVPGYYSRLMMDMQDPAHTNGYEERRLISFPTRTWASWSSLKTPGRSEMMRLHPLTRIYLIPQVS